MRCSMNHKYLLAALGAALASAAFAQTPAPKEDLVPVAIDTRLGRIVVDLDRGRAPISTANFLHYVDTHRYDGESFYRAMPIEGGGLVQGGIRSDPRKLYKPIAHEPTSLTRIHNLAGTIAMARGAPGTAQADFFILLADTPGFDAGNPQGDADGYAAFGHVTQGMDIVKAIFAAPVSPTKGHGALKGQMLDPPIKIIKVARVTTK
jgi:peptidyl-prolyl cis-trans isomerase A (cyclophilin A)